METILALLLFASPDPPPQAWEFWSRPAMEAVVATAVSLGLTHPAAEVVDYDTPGGFRGAVYVMRRRFIGKPLPYPHDPIFGK